MLRTAQAALAAVVLLFAAPALAGPQFVTGVNGYDVVSYQSGEPTRGLTSITHFWNGVTWLFATEENRDLFAADPEAYAPQFDGYCAFAAALGYKAPGDPAVWEVVDGLLYLNVNEQAKSVWLQDVPGNIAKAEENWPGLNAI